MPNENFAMFEESLADNKNVLLVVLMNLYNHKGVHEVPLLGDNQQNAAGRSLNHDEESDKLSSAFFAILVSFFGFCDKKLTYYNLQLSPRMYRSTFFQFISQSLKIAKFNFRKFLQDMLHMIYAILYNDLSLSASNPTYKIVYSSR